MKRVIDVHSHVYLPRYMKLLKQRNKLPKIVTNCQGNDRLIILPNEDADASTQSGRPIGKEYYDINVKSSFMSKHQITTSVLSLANPWLDFLDKDQASSMATLLNKDLNDVCQQESLKFYGFGVLPNNDADSCVKEMENISQLPKLKGVIMGTIGVGKGLDDPQLIPVFEAAAKHGLLIFLHPHYGVSNELFGGLDNGHVLPLALGFPFETTIAITRMILSGLFDKVKNLKILLAHSGGTVPFLAGRLDSCVIHDNHIRERLERKPSDYLKDMYYDAVSYHVPALKACAELVGADRMMFGTDHPFFPPLDGKDPDTSEWESVNWNYEAIEKAFDRKIADGILSRNAERILGI